MSLPDPDLGAFLARFAKPYDPTTDTYRRPPYAAPVKAGKATAIYNAHSYHTKVPPQGIEPYIKHYTNPGDLILDPFCGSGMTGVAALRSGRSVILNDLSPAAAHIAYNYCTPVDVDALKREFTRIKAAVKDEFDWLYGTTCDRCGGDATIEYTVWSDVLECSRCGQEMVLWDVAVDHSSGKVLDSFTCPNCNLEQQKRGSRWLRSIPVLTVFECHSCKPARSQHATTDEEKDRIAEIESREIPYWYPTTPFLEQDWEMWRGVHRDQGITSVDKFYTKRNLWALARLWNESAKNPPRLAEAIQFGLTAINNYINKKQSYGGGGGGVSGTLYVPSFVMEKNVWETAERKFKNLLETFAQLPKGNASITCGSASQLTSIPNETIDYVFTDPPFGSNLFYADINFIWESWIGEYTEQKYEAVVHTKHKNKNTLSDYARLMTESFCEMQRVLKPGRWASVVFHNSDDKIWQTILEAAQAAGLELVEINSFDKEQLSFKGIRGAKGLERVTNKDIVLNLRKPSSSRARTLENVPAAKNGDAEARIVQQLAEFLASKPNPSERTLQHFWNVVLHDMLAQGAVEVSMEQVGAMLPHYFKEVDGKWYLRGEAVYGGNTFNIRNDTDAIAWLTAVLTREPQTTGDLIPKWQVETAASGDVDPGRLERLLEQDFWQDKKTGQWRMPTDDERAKLTQVQDISDQAHLRVIRKYLAGESEHRPTQWQLVEWIRFAYRREAFPEVVGLAAQVDESQVDPSFRKEYKKIVAVSRMRADKSGNSGN